MNTNRTYYSRDAEVRAARDRATLTIICLMFGLGMGTALALLFAPASGKKLRDDLGHALEEGVHSGRHIVEPAIGQIERELHDLRRKVEERMS